MQPGTVVETLHRLAIVQGGARGAVSTRDSPQTVVTPFVEDVIHVISKDTAGLREIHHDIIIIIYHVYIYIYIQ